VFCFLHPKLKSLAELAAHPSRARMPATTCVQLTVGEDGVCRAVATDGRVMGVATLVSELVAVGHGPPVAPHLIPDDLQLEEFVPGTGLIPAEHWKAVFKLCKKAPVACRLEGQELLLAAGGQSVSAALDTDQGRFPYWERVLPKRRPVLRVHLDPDLLIRLLKVCKDFTDGENSRVTFSFYDLAGTAPVAVQVADQQAGVFFDGLIVPLVVRDQDRPRPRAEEEPEEEEVEAGPEEEMDPDLRHRLEAIVTIAADSVDRLRPVDVPRVLDAAVEAGCLDEMGAYLDGHGLGEAVADYLNAPETEEEE